MLTREILWTQKKKRMTHVASQFITDPNFISATGIFPKLKSISRATSHANVSQFASPQPRPKPRHSDMSLIKSPFAKQVQLDDTSDDKMNKLKSIYSESKKSKFVKKVQKDPLTGQKSIKGKTNLKRMIRNATAGE